MSSPGDNAGPAAREPSADDVAALAQLSLFGALSSETIRYLASRCEEVRIPAGETFCAQGESGDCLFVLRSGQAIVERAAGGERHRLAEVTAGDFFGEVALVAIRPRTASVRAVRDSTALRLPHRAIYDLSQRDMEQFALLQMNLAREIGRRLARADEALARRGDGEGGGARAER